MTLFDLETGRIWKQMSRQDAEETLTFAHGLGDTVRRYETTDRTGQPLRIAYQQDPHVNDRGTVFEFTN